MIPFFKGAIPYLAAPTIDAAVAAPNTATAHLYLFSTGELLHILNGSATSFRPEWNGLPVDFTSAEGAQYEVRMTDGLGFDPGSDSVNVWLSLGSNRQWVLSQSGLGTKNRNGCVLEIRSAATGQVFASLTYTIFRASSIPI